MFVPAGAAILHADLDAFYASVEQRDNPRLRGRPVLAGGGVVLAASYEAKAHGVRTAMGETQARRLCPRAGGGAPRFEAYSQGSKEVFKSFAEKAPVVVALASSMVVRRPAGPVTQRSPERRALGHADRAGRPGHAATANGHADLPHRCPAPALRRLRPSHAVVHAARTNARHPVDPGRSP